jgi:molybdate transport system substrate-binding protein
MKIRLFLLISSLLFIFLLSLAIKSYSSQKTITVFAAASLTEPFKEIGESFETLHPDIKVVFNFAGSQQLYVQLKEGAQADIFVSANKREIDGATKNSLILPDSHKVFIKNRLIIIYPKNNPGNIYSLTDLARPGIKLDIGYKSVPVGLYTLKMLDKMSNNKSFGKDFKKRVLNNVVSFEDNVKSVLTKVSLGEADGGVVYVSDVSGKRSGEIGTIEIPDDFNQIALYYIAPLISSQTQEEAKDFIVFVLSKTGQKIMSEHGFIPLINDKNK